MITLLSNRCEHTMAFSQLKYRVFKMQLSSPTFFLQVKKLHFVHCAFAAIGLWGLGNLTLHYSPNLDQGPVTQVRKRRGFERCAGVVDAGVHVQPQMLAALFCVEEALGVFVLIRWDSCGHLDSVYVPPGLHKPAPFIIFQHTHSNWATSPSAVTHHFVHSEQWKDTEVPGLPQACHVAGLCIWIAYVDSWAVRWHRADPGTALSSFSPLLMPVCLSTHSGVEVWW